MQPAPRIFGICATAEDVVAVVRRGPSNWMHLGLWDLAAQRFQPGSWIRARVYQQRCDVSPDGRYLCYFALNGGAQWDAGDTYIAVSRLPWFTALAAWGTQGTYARGAHFVKDRTQWDLPAPDEGEDGPLRRRYGMALTRNHDFAVERRRGWTDVPGPAPSGREVRVERRIERHHVGRPQPHQSRRRDHDSWLVASGGYAAYRSLDERFYRPPAYELRDGPDGPTLVRLDDQQWADWARDGRLLAATVDGRLQIRDAATGAVGWECDLAELRPEPERPPEQARHW